MFLDVLPYSELIRLDNTIWVLTAETGNSIYDFRFDQSIPCCRPHQWDSPINVVGRIGAFANYSATFASLLDDGMKLVHSPEEHQRCSELPGWFPLLRDITPKSIVFDNIPSPHEVSEHLNWPIFVKGARQTSRHRRSLSIIENPEAFKEAMAIYRQDPILRWQLVVCREFIPLRLVEEAEFDRLPSSFEFRTFWWKGNLVGFGPYWWQGKHYRITEDERRRAEEIAREAARRVNVPFLVVDVAQTAAGRWIVIECNDGQESGYAGVSPIGLWQNMITIEKCREQEI